MAFGRFSYLSLLLPGGNKFIRYSSGGFTIEKNNIESKALTGSFLPSGSSIGTRYPKGGISGIELEEYISPFLVKGLLGKSNVAVNAGRYIYTITLPLNPNTKYLLEMEEYKIEWLRSYSNVKITDLTIKGDINSYITMDVNGIAKSYTNKNLSEKQSPTFIGSVFKWSDVDVKINNTSVPIKNFELKISEKADVSFVFNKSYIPADILRGAIEASFKVDLDLNQDSVEYFNKMFNEDEFTLTIEMINKYNNKLTISAGKMKVKDYSENSGDELLKSTITFDIISANTIDDTIKFIYDVDTEIVDL